MKRRLALALFGLALLTGCEFSLDEPTASSGYGIDPVAATDANFDQLVLGASKPVMVDCYADWCGPCQMLKPTVHELAADYEGRAIVAQLDVDVAPKISQRYEISSIPTLLFFKDGKLVDQVVGYTEKAELADKLDKLLNDSSVASTN